MEIPWERYVIFHELFYTRLEPCFVFVFIQLISMGILLGISPFRLVYSYRLIELPMIHLGKISKSNDNLDSLRNSVENR